MCFSRSPKLIAELPPPRAPSTAKWADRWTASDFKQADGTAGEFSLTAGKWYGDAEADKGIQTGPDARFFAISADMGKTVSNEGKTLVLQVRALSRSPLPSRARCSDARPTARMMCPEICESSTVRPPPPPSPRPPRPCPEQAHEMFREFRPHLSSARQMALCTVCTPPL